MFCNTGRYAIGKPGPLPPWPGARRGWSTAFSGAGAGWSWFPCWRKNAGWNGGAPSLSAVIYFARGQLELLTALPYLLGGLLGGLVGGKLFPKVPVVWLRRAFALVIFYGAWKALTA